MKTAKQKVIGTAEKTRNIEIRWQLAALFTCFTIVILLLAGILFIKKEFTTNYSLSTSYSTGDVALFVAMPLLNAVVK